MSDHMLVVFVSLLIYFVPVVIAGARGHRSYGSIAVVTTLFGWTIVGWVVALAWSLSGNVKTKSE